MQSLISPVDHESRNNIFNNDETELNENEATPLLHNFPRRVGHGMNATTISIISGLILLFLVALGIGIYLLVLQNNSENILPPVNEPYLYVPRKEWDETQLSRPFQAKHVILQQTDTRQCWDLEGCLLVLKDMKANLRPNEYLPYNFLIADGIVFEIIGWRTSLVPELSAAVVGFIGNFSHVPPTIEQINTAKSLLRAAVKDNNLADNYTIIGKASSVIPRYLFNSFKNIPQWNEALSDDF